ncbi:C-GCAxxG-C-C family (seleno)protein [Chloroflexota bacterium]
MSPLKKTKEEIMKKAEELGVEYEAIYKGCAQTTFYAVTDALRWGGLELIPEELQDKMYAGICLLTAGNCMTGEGTCGAVVGSTMASGFAFGQLSDMKDPAVADRAGAQVRDSLLTKFYEEYGSILCKDVMRKYFGKAWDLTSREMTEEFLGITDGCVISKTAIMIAGILIDKYEKGELKIPA